MVKISIIIAAYNIEGYIEKCISSLVNQTFTNIEIVVVNDGSTDDTPNIINRLAKNDSRIKIINKKNSGLIEARRSGFENSTGDFLIFIDGDDWMDIESCEKIYKEIKESDYDVVNYTYYTAYEGGSNIKVEIKEAILEKNEYLKELLLINLRPCIWSKAIRRQFLIDNNIVFPKNVTYGEDLAMSINIACNNPKVITINEPLYYYFQRSGSITNSKLTKQALDVVTVLEYVKKYMSDKGIYNNFKQEYEYLAYRNLFYSFVISRNDINDVHRALYNKWRELYVKEDQNKYIKMHRKVISCKEKIRMSLFDINYHTGATYTKLMNLLRK